MALAVALETHAHRKPNQKTRGGHSPGQVRGVGGHINQLQVAQGSAGDELVPEGKNERQPDGRMLSTGLYEMAMSCLTWATPPPVPLRIPSPTLPTRVSRSGMCTSAVCPLASASPSRHPPIPSAGSLLLTTMLVHGIPDAWSLGAPAGWANGLTPADLPAAMEQSAVFLICNSLLHKVQGLLCCLWEIHCSHHLHIWQQHGQSEQSIFCSCPCRCLSSATPACAPRHSITIYLPNGLPSGALEPAAWGAHGQSKVLHKQSTQREHKALRA